MPLILALKDKEKLFINAQTLQVHLEGEGVELTDLENGSMTTCKLNNIKEVTNGVCLKLARISKGYAEFVFFTSFNNKIYRESYLNKVGVNSI
ncbi:hypothetical protein [Colwellia sp. 12G3]|uniref:hypothetical protein n=1 Tax=Colwellia sp. 12G3 TaxID=2058299 RepID=UPI000C33B9CD|nr:hypothetical protein [Colwellia sp. 12G3]PKI12771.1 hypothetical protein CXF71_18730 [Colwellia sp. 12G3]